jgi:hypothetical protein
MRDVPDDFLPDEPKHIGREKTYSVEIDGVLFPGEPGDGEQKPGVCDWCDEQREVVYLGVDTDSSEPRWVCLICRATHASTPDHTTE